MFCFRHRWVFLAKTYAPATHLLERATNGRVLEHDLHGVTTFLFRCGRCTDLRTVEMLGDTAGINEAALRGDMV